MSRRGSSLRPADVRARWGPERHEGAEMKFLLIMNMNPVVWDGLTADEQAEIGNGHGAFIDTIKKSGEMITTRALADPSQSFVVRVRDAQPAVTDGPYAEAKEYL